MVKVFRLLCAALPALGLAIVSCSRESGQGGARDQPADPQVGSKDRMPQQDPANRSTMQFKLSTDAIQSESQELADAYDPNKDGWTSEVFHDRSSSTIKVLGRLLSESPDDPLNEMRLAAVAAPELATTALWPADAAKCFDDGTFVVNRPAEETKDAATGLSQVAAELNRLMAPWKGNSPVRIWLKQIRVEQTSEDTWRSMMFFSGVGPTPAGPFQRNATWYCRWTTAGGKPLLTAIEARDHEEILLKDAQHPLFADCTEGVLGGNRSFQAQVKFGSNYWLERLSRYPTDNLQGVSVGDVNGDGLEDVYLSQGTGLPNKLFIAQPDGTAIDRSREYGVDILDETRSSLIIDLDNDGDGDMVIATREVIVFMENDAGMRFREKFRVAGIDAMSLAAADVDGDGLLDVYISNYQNSLHEIGPLSNPVPYNDAVNGAPNTMIRNAGNWRFEDVTSAWGLDRDNNRFSLAVAFEDYDNDGDLDLYVSNDFGRNNLYRNVAAKGATPAFVNVAAENGVEDTSFGMSAAFGDVNGDGFFDIYVSNMASGAGNRVTYQRNFMSGSTPAQLEKMRYLARGNSLFVNDTGQGFQDLSKEAEVMFAQWAWASMFCDINNDGWPDLITMNGFLSGPDEGDL